MITWLLENWFISILVIIILITIIRVKMRGFFWKTRDGRGLTLKEFFKSWGRGIEGITPLQSVKTQILGTWIVVSGMIAGLIINLLVRIKYQWHWISVILFGSLIITSLSMIGLYQKYKILKKVEDTLKEIQDD